MHAPRARNFCGTSSGSKCAWCRWHMRPQCIGRTFCVRRAPYRIDCNCPHKQLPAPKAATRTRKKKGKHACHGGTLHLQGMQGTMGFVHNLGSHASIDITSLCQTQHDPKHLPQSQDPAGASRAYCRTCIARSPWPTWRDSLYTSMSCSILTLPSCHPLSPYSKWGTRCPLRRLAAA